MGSSWTRARTHVPCIGRRILNHCTTREALLVFFFCFVFFNIYCFAYFFFLNFIYLFMYFWLCWVFVSVQGLSLVAASGGHSSSQCAGLSLLWLTGLVAPWHVGSSQTRARTRIPCIGRQTLNHWATREAPCWCFLKAVLIMGYALYQIYSFMQIVDFVDILWITDSYAHSFIWQMFITCLLYARYSACAAQNKGRGGMEWFIF